MSEQGRRSATGRRGLHPTTPIGVLLVVATLGALALVRPHEPAARTAPPEETQLREASLACPAALSDAAVRVATSTQRARGEVRVVAGTEERRAEVRPRRVTELGAEPAPVVVRGEGELAPGLLAARFGARGLAATSCASPQPTTWFTGLGAGGGHDSVLELANPDDGLAVADITVHGRGGPLDVPDLRGVSVRGHQSLRLDLAQVVPRRGELALEIVVSRGRLAASVLDRIPSLGSRPGTEDWLAGQTAPGNRTLLLGLAPAARTAVLAVANPGEDEARVTVRVVTADSAFVPEGVSELRVPPQSVRTQNLAGVLRRAVRDGALGLEVSSTEPVTAGLRSLADGDLSHAPSVLPSGEPMTALVPPGSASVVLADARGVGVVTVDSWRADGKELEQQRLEVRRDQGGVIDLPRGATLVRVTPSRTAVSAAALVTGSGATVVPFRELDTSALVPDVRPGLP